MTAIERIWYGNNVVTALLLPAVLGIWQRCSAQAPDLPRPGCGQHYLAAPVPVIVVGNISVGGTGKTPVVIALLEYLKSLGYQPGVVARGYGAKPDSVPLLLRSDTPATQCGDEPLLVHRRTGAPVVIDPDRPRAVRHLLQHCACDVIISDDGMQHYALYRDIELAVVNTERGLGNRSICPQARCAKRLNAWRRSMQCYLMEAVNWRVCPTPSVLPCKPRASFN